MATHLRRCAACAETVAGIRSLTTALRAAPFEPLGEPAFVAAAEPRRSHPLAVRLALAATLAVVAAGLGMFAGTLGDTSPSQGPPPGPDQPLALLPEDAKKDVQGLRPSKRTSRDEVGFGSSELFGGV